MELRIAVKGRRSVRKFKPDEVPENIIREIIEDARWAPSGGNTQSWELYIAVSETLKRYKEATRRNFLEDVPGNIDGVVTQATYPDAMRDRSQALAKQMLGSQGIAREDRQARRQFYASMHAILDAPCLILFCLDKALSFYSTLDTGMLLQNICLLAHERGLGTCIMGAAVRYPDLARQILSVPENKNVIIGVALGYPDWDAPINNFPRERAELSEFVFWSK